MTPQRIRKLRGELSRAAFARRVGVTPHTVYRWELPSDAPESRRPRGRELAKLELLARGSLAEPGPSGAKPVLPEDRALPPEVTHAISADEDLASVLPSLERVVGGDIRRAYTELVQLTAKQDLSLNTRALARFGIALVELVQCSDARAAFLAISPALLDARASLLSSDVEARVFAAAALVHALPDASLFDLGRVHAYAGRAEALAWNTDPQAVCVACLATFCAATLVSDKELLERAYLRLDRAAFTELPPLLDLHVEEFKALRPMLSGKTAASIRAFEAIIERAAEHGYAVLHARVLGHVAQQHLENMADPEAVLAISRRAKQIGAGARIAPGFHGLFALRTEIEALLRLGRTAEALEVVGELDAWSSDTGIAPLAAAPAHARLLYLTGRLEALRVLAARLRECSVSSLKATCHAYAAFVEAMACTVSSEDPLTTVAAFEQAEAEATGAPSPFLLRDVLLYRVIAHTVAGQDEAARIALRRVQRVNDLFPSPWITAHLRRIEGIMLAARGHWSEGRQLIESAMATFDLAQDRCDAALTRHLVAVFADSYSGRDPEGDIERTRAELDRVGVQVPRSLLVAAERLRRSRQTAETEPTGPQRLGIDALVVPIQRLSVRGAAPGLILRELTSVASRLLPDRTIRLEEIDATGKARRIAGAGGSDDGVEWIDFGDGSGRLLRFGVTGGLCVLERSAIAMLTTMTSLALEVAMLRGCSEQGDPSSMDERAPELPGFIAVSPEMRKLRDELVRLAASRATVIITGESGSGKELVARAVHDLSDRSKKSYVAFNCATVPRDLFEGQLFGYRKGAFTGASSDHPGVIRAANGGTLFLDEIGELPLDVQPKLLRFLENAEVFALGERRPMRVDVRVLAATHRDLAALVREGRFREDLYYRLHVLPIHVPPLRERREDIAVLARHFVREVSRRKEPPVLAPDAIAALTSYAWPGNVRELRNVIERAIAFSPKLDVIRAEHLRLTKP
ncbi:sigma 54-interacting transcriptional regulator [Sorangium sp. So ce726]|uniref:sigma 54-interacting transcriptional regulator n=1 Tax=Sorangium sp. So ce726 TaxID=3133319 RepID=UPI003F5DB60D